ncbi:MAG: peptidoglycan DD-metalloendopeptidase family protein [Bacteroidetes bacterium]|nr:peptidoglycan DD-metalloendopeptidase family protein [Bacteroidota bacterium]
MKVISNKIVAIIVSLIIALTGLAYFACPQELFPQSIEDELSEVKEEREQTQKKIEEAKANEKRYTNEVSQVENQLLTALSELGALNIQLSDAKTKVDQATVEIVLKEEELKTIEDELDQNLHILSDRVVYTYKKGPNQILELLLDVKNFVEFNSNLKLVNIFTQQGNDNVQQVKEKRDAVLSMKKVIIKLREMQKEHQEEIAGLVSQAENKTEEIEDLYGEKKYLLSKTKADKAALIKMEEELADKEKELIRILESYRYGIPPSGKLLWPSAGPLLSGFGYRIHPILGTNRLHAGIDIGSPYGTSVKAAAGGKVIQAGYFGGYGYSIIIYHGGGYATWYAHLSSINVSLGQMVERGSVIGRVGSTGFSTGPHLHFEIRINGAPQNPMGYF